MKIEINLIELIVNVVLIIIILISVDILSQYVKKWIKSISKRLKKKDWKCNSCRWLHRDESRCSTCINFAKFEPHVSSKARKLIKEDIKFNPDKVLVEEGYCEAGRKTSECFDYKHTKTCKGCISYKEG